MIKLLQAHMIVILFLAQTGCVNVDVKKPQRTQQVKLPSHMHNLPAQELSQGACGLFFWTQTIPPLFVFFQKEGVNTAKLFYDDRQIVMQSTHVIDALKDQLGVNLSYTGSVNMDIKTINIKGVYGEMLQGGRRIPKASIIINKLDNWQEIIPVSGVYVCQ